MSRGVDISTYNTVNDWSAVKKSIDFAILKVINKSNQPDSKFASHLKGALSVGLPVIGVYNYSYATSVQKAREDATAVVNVLKANGLATAVWLDVEDSCQKNLGSKLIDIVRAYKEVIDAAGLPFGVYTGLSFYNSYLEPFFSRITDIPMWIARYPSTAQMAVTKNPSESKKPSVINMVAWQYTSKGVVPGIAGNVDLNDYYAPIPVTTPILPAAPADNKYYPKYTGKTNTSLISGLAGVGEKDTSYNHRAKIAAANGIKNYKGTAAQNLQMLSLLKQGKLIKA
jgi:GH25 family lysozyme M1 (1,4-beta-N-acetylmuramidase)